MNQWLRTLVLGMVMAGSLVPARPCAAAAPGSVDADPALWVVSDADTTIYLFGTVHLLRPELRWFDEAVADAFAASSELQIEVLMPEDPLAMAPMLMTLATDPDGRTLSSKLNARQREAFNKGIARSGLPAEMFESFEPWFVALQLTQVAAQQAGLDPQHGVEQVLTASARSTGKRISGLETVEEQLGYLDGTPESEQIASLLETIEDPAQTVDMLNSLIAAWARGDAQRTGVLLNESLEATPRMRRILLTDRNRRWASTLAQRMKQPGKVFVAVGAGHLVGADSVQAQLALLGLNARRIAY